MNQKTYKFMKMFLSFKEYETEKGKLVIDELVEGAEAMLIDENGELIPATDGEYLTEDGKIVIAEGKVTSIETVEPEQEPEQEIEPETEPEHEEEQEPEQEPEPAANPELEEANRIIEEKDAKIAELEAKIAELEEQLSKPVEEPIGMRANVSSYSQQTIKDNPALKYFNN